MSPPVNKSSAKKPSKSIDGSKNRDKLSHQRSLQQTARRSSHDQRRNSESSALDEAAKKFAATNKNSLPHNQSTTGSTQSLGAANVSSVGTQKLDDSSTSDIGAAMPTDATTTQTLNPNSEVFVPHNSTLDSSADVEDSIDMMDCTMINADKANKSVSVENGTSSTPKGGAAVAGQPIDTGIFTPGAISISTGDAAIASITASLKFGPKVASNADANEGTNTTQLHKKKT